MGDVFTGERWEAYSELLFLRARYYEPGTGRFIQKDPWPGDHLRPLTLNEWSYVENGPASRVDLTGYFSDATINRSLGGFSLDSAFGYRPGFGSEDLGRWGLLALLRDAQDGDTIVPRYASFWYQGDHYPLRPSADGAWSVECDEDSQKLVFSNLKLGMENVSLGSFLMQLTYSSDNLVRTLDKWWRPKTLRLHWYELNNGRFYGDWIDPASGKRMTSLPDLLLLSASAEVGLGLEAGFVMDRYGHQYVSGGVGVGMGFALPSYLEGYASGSLEPTTVLDEAGLRNVIEGPGFSWAIATTVLGGGFDVWGDGITYLFGGWNLAAGAGGSFGVTRHLTQDRNKAWDWVDNGAMVRNYGCSLRATFDPDSGQQWCECK